MPECYVHQLALAKQICTNTSTLTNSVHTLLQAMLYKLDAQVHIGLGLGCPGSAGCFSTRMYDNSSMENLAQRRMILLYT